MADKSRRRDNRVKRSFLFEAVDEFFDVEENWEQMESVVCKHKSKRSGISLRLLDFLCTVFARQSTDPCLVHTADGTVTPLVDVYNESLDVYGKIHYDCFRRDKTKLCLKKHGRCMYTTLAQLVFFKDIIENGILEYARDNVERIKEAMIAHKTHKSGGGSKAKCQGPQLLPLSVATPLFSR